LQDFYKPKRALEAVWLSANKNITLDSALPTTY